MIFSVGRIKIGEDTLAKCTNITIRYDGSLVDLYAGGHMDPHEVETGNRVINISVEYAEWAGDIDPDTLLPNTYVDVQLLASTEDVNRGLQGLTLTRCKAGSWEAASTQDGFVTYRLELRKAKSTS